MCLNLSENQLTIDCYTHQILYMNPMLTTNQKPLTDAQKLRNSNITLKKANKPQGKKIKERNREELQKYNKTSNNRKQLSIREILQGYELIFQQKLSRPERRGMMYSKY